MEEITKEFNDYVVIGLGKFGRSIAKNLSEEGKNVLAIDGNPKNIESVENIVTHAVSADVSKKDVLYSLGVQNFDCAIVCIGDDLSASMLSTLICKELGVPYIIAKAQNDQHKELLEKVGANLVIFPEVYMSKKLTTALVDPYANELVKFNDNYKIVEIKCPNNWESKTIGEINVRKKYNVNIILIRRDEEVIEPLPESLLEDGDSLVIAGTPKNIESIEHKVEERVDMKTLFADALNED